MAITHKNMNNNIRMIAIVVMCLHCFLCFAEYSHDIEIQKNWDKYILTTRSDNGIKNVDKSIISNNDSVARKIRYEILREKEEHHNLFNPPYSNRKYYKFESPEETIKRYLKGIFKNRNSFEIIGGVFFCIVAIFSFFGKKAIKYTRSVNTTIIIRKTVWGIRIVLVIFFCSFWCFVIYYLIPSLLLRILAIPFTVAIATGYCKDKGWFGNISLYTKQKFMDVHKQYVLYLRGFGDDIPNNDLGLGLETKNKVETKKFDEKKFFKKINEKITVCAVGLPQELDAPYGAKRIYLDDSTWRNGVLDLMEHATYIIIKVNDRDSCVWEINQAQKFLDKTVFLVDNKLAYQNVIDKLASSNYLLNDLIPEYCYFYMSPELHKWITVESKDRRFDQFPNDLERIFCNTP